MREIIERDRVTVIKGVRETQGRKGKEERKKEMKKEGKRERRKRKEGKKERGKYEMAGHGLAGGRRTAHGGNPKPKNKGGASVVHFGFLEFLKWCFGERNYSSLERVLRGEEDCMAVGGQDGVGGAGDSGEDNGEDGLFWWKEEEEEGGVDSVVVVVEMEEEMGERMVVETVVEKVERVASQGGYVGWFWAAGCWLEEGRKKK